MRKINACGEAVYTFINAKAILVGQKPYCIAVTGCKNMRLSSTKKLLRKIKFHGMRIGVYSAPITLHRS